MRWELPPRARRIQAGTQTIHLAPGTTSACAENTLLRFRGWRICRNYLRVRGEYLTNSTEFLKSMELPPRARRIHVPVDSVGVVFGTTSACAENTLFLKKLEPGWWNYLRVRGEYRTKAHNMAKRTELPPRARRIRGRVPPIDQIQGTTSACAENTPAHVTAAQVCRNYLRVRGEYHLPRSIKLNDAELPPRARRILRRPRSTQRLNGTTSACAENTRASHWPSAQHWNYLRVRGEYYDDFILRLDALELPPRARRIQAGKRRFGKAAGTTSACAENTMVLRVFRCGRWNYLRVRGEYALISGWA